MTEKLESHGVNFVEAFGKLTTTEIMSQPEAWAETINQAKKGGVQFPSIDFGKYNRIFTVGSGSSYYLSMILKSLIAKRTPVPCFAVPSCEVFLSPDTHFRHDERYLVFATSRSGRSTEALIAADYLAANFNADVVSLGCYPDSPLNQKAKYTLLAPAGQEHSVVMTRSFSTMLLTFELFYSLTTGAEVGWAEELPSFGRSLIDTYKDRIASLINDSHFEHFVYLGSGEFYGVAREAALKMEEMAIVPAEAYHSLEYRHGPKSVAGQKTLVVAFLLPEQGHYQPSLLRDLKELGTTVVAVGEHEAVSRLSGVADLPIPLPKGVDQYQALCLVMPVAHLLGLYQALKRGVNPDNPRNLTQVVEL